MSEALFSRSRSSAPLGRRRRSLGEGAALVAARAPRALRRRARRRRPRRDRRATARRSSPPERDASLVHASPEALERAIADALADAGVAAQRRRRRRLGRLGPARLRRGGARGDRRASLGDDACVVAPEARPRRDARRGRRDGHARGHRAACDGGPRRALASVRGEPFARAARTALVTSHGLLRQCLGARHARAVALVRSASCRRPRRPWSAMVAASRMEPPLSWIEEKAHAELARVRKAREKQVYPYFREFETRRPAHADRRQADHQLQLERLPRPHQPPEGEGGGQARRRQVRVRPLELVASAGDDDRARRARAAPREVVRASRSACSSRRATRRCSGRIVVARRQGHDARPRRVQPRVHPRRHLPRRRRPQERRPRSASSTTTRPRASSASSRRASARTRSSWSRASTRSTATRRTCAEFIDALRQATTRSLVVDDAHGSGTLGAHGRGHRSRRWASRASVPIVVSTLLARPSAASAACSSASGEVVELREAHGARASSSARRCPSPSSPPPRPSSTCSRATAPKLVARAAPEGALLPRQARRGGLRPRREQHAHHARHVPRRAQDALHARRAARVRRAHGPAHLPGGEDRARSGCA